MKRVGGSGKGTNTPCREQRGILERCIVMTFMALGVFAVLLWRAVLPLDCKWYWRVLAGVVTLGVSFKFKILQLLGGHYFAPDLPGWFLIIAGQIYITAFLFLLFIVVADTVLLCVTCGKVAVKLFKEKSFDWKMLLHKHPLLNKVHAAGLVLAFVLSLVGMWYGLSMPRVRRVEILSDRVPAQADGVTLAVLADLHVDRLNNRSKIRKIVELTNSLKADFICIVGDFSDGAKAHQLETLSELSNLRAKYGVYGVAGNHEYYSGYHELMAHFKKIGLPILSNENVYFENLKLRICGIPDSHARRLGEKVPDIAAALAGGDKDDYRILLSHEPRTAHKAAKLGADLQFSGHTHGGMVLGFDYLVARSNGGFAWGNYQLGKMTLVMSNGTCMWSGFPVRLGHPAEIVLVTLKRR